VRILCDRKEKPTEAICGWKGWFICGDCLESLIKERGANGSCFPRRIIEELKVLEIGVPPPPDNMA